MGCVLRGYAGENALPSVLRSRLRTAVPAELAALPIDFVSYTNQPNAKGCKSYRFAHQDVRAEPRFAKWSDCLEPRFLKHRRRAMRGLISKRASQPPADRITLNNTATLLLNRFERGLQRGASDSTVAVLLEHCKTCDSPQLLPADFTRERGVFARIVDARKLFARAVLTPADRLAVGVDEDSVRAAFIDESLLLPLVPRAPLGAGSQPFTLGQAARPVKMHAHAEVEAVPLREKLHKIRPGFW